MKKSLTLKRETFLIGFLFLSLMSLLFTSIFLHILYSTNMGSAKNSLRQCNSQIVTYVEGVFHENESLLRMLAYNTVLRNGPQWEYNDVVDIFDHIHSGNKNITYIYAGYSNGSLFIRDYNTPVDFDALNRPWYLAAEQTEGVAQLVYRDIVTGEWLFSQCTQLKDDAGNMVGAVCIDSSNASIVRQLSTKYQYESQRSFILDRNGDIIIHPNEREINRAIGNQVGTAVWSGIINGGNNYASYQSDGMHTMAYFERIPRSEFWVGTAIYSQEVLNPILQNLAYILLLTTAISLIVGYLLSCLLTHRFARPVVELGNRIRLLAEGQPPGTWNMGFSNAEIRGIAENIEVLVHDIANQKEKRREAEYMSFHDSMTGLYNRRFFEEELRRLDVARNWPLCIICCDINGLKMVNDIFGHAVGDQLIESVARVLEQNCRADDILARMGGDEFALILPHTVQSDVEHILRRIQDGFPKDSVGGAWVSASLGYASKNKAEVTVEEVMRLADEMMYAYKRQESADMRLHTVENIIAVAQQEGLIPRLHNKEEKLLYLLGEALCPQSLEPLKQAYHLRQIGLCSLVCSVEQSESVKGTHHTETSHRILSSVEDYRTAAGYISHYMEHWDGGGWPMGLSGQDIPLPSRMIAVVEATCRGVNLSARSGTWYDPMIVALVANTVPLSGSNFDENEV